MLFPSFGFENARKLSPVKRLMELLRQIEKKHLNSYEQQALLLELYETEFKIFDHENNQHRPLALVEMHPKEMVEPFSREDRLMHRFAALKIGDMFNMSFNEFLNQPRERVEKMLRKGEEHERAESKKNRELQQTIDAAGRQTESR